MAFVNGTTTSDFENNHKLERNRSVTNDQGERAILCKESNAQHHRRHRLFKSFEDDEDNCSSTSSILLFHMNQPSPSDIRQWMADTQDTVGKVITNWQQNLIDRCSKISDLLGQLVQFVLELEEDAGPCRILSGKCVNKHGSFESVINVYLHLIVVSHGQIALSLEQQQIEDQKDPNDRKKRTKRLKRQQHLMIAILGQFAVLAEDTLKYLQAHRKFLAPTCKKMVDMKNNLYHFLRQLIVDPTDQIIPLECTVFLDDTRKKENVKWIKNRCEEYQIEETKIASWLAVQLESQQCLLQIEDNDTNKSHVELAVEERLALILLVLKQLGLSVGSSNKACRDGQNDLLDIHRRLLGKFQDFVRNLIVETRQHKLLPENCSETLKQSLCQLEVKFHQVEIILDGIPQHLKRIMGVADHCSRQILHEFGLKEQFEREELSWISPIEDVSEEFFKSKQYFFQGCFPYLWGIIARMFYRDNGNAPSGDLTSTSKKVKQFWDEVRSEMQDFQKEIKLKEMETEYGVQLKIPFYYNNLSRILEKSEDHLLSLSKYIQNQVKQRQRLITSDHLTPRDSEKICSSDLSSVRLSAPMSQTPVQQQSLPQFSAKQVLIALASLSPSLTETIRRPQCQENSKQPGDPVNEFKYVSQEYCKHKLIINSDYNEKLTATKDVPVCVKESFASTDGHNSTALPESDELKCKLESYLVVHETTTHFQSFYYNIVYPCKGHSNKCQSNRFVECSCFDLLDFSCDF